MAGILRDAAAEPSSSWLPRAVRYVTRPTPRRGPFWNAPFGAARLMRELDDVRPDTVLAAFTEGRTSTTTDPAA